MWGLGGKKSFMGVFDRPVVGYGANILDTTFELSYINLLIFFNCFPNFWKILGSKVLSTKYSMKGVEKLVPTQQRHLFCSEVVK